LLCSGVKVRRVRKAQDWKGHKLTINSAVDEVYSRNSIAGGATSSTAVTATSTSNNNGNTTVVNMSLTYAGSPDKATAIEATGQQTDEAAFVAAMRLAAVSTKPLIQAQQALEAAVLTQQQEQQQRHLAQLWPSQQLQQTVGQLTEQPLKALFTKHKLGSNDCSNGGSSSITSSDKESRAAALSSIQSGLLRDLQRVGLLAEAGQLAAAAGQVSREDALRAFDVLQSRVMREVLLESEVSTNIPKSVCSTRTMPHTVAACQTAHQDKEPTAATDTTAAAVGSLRTTVCMRRGSHHSCTTRRTGGSQSALTSVVSDVVRRHPGALMDAPWMICAPSVVRLAPWPALCTVQGFLREERRNHWPLQQWDTTPK
jgi:hypothetical protein